jgi:hypothetical protein
VGVRQAQDRDLFRTAKFRLSTPSSKQESLSSEMGPGGNMRCGNPEPLMSQMGHSRPRQSSSSQGMSGHDPKAEAKLRVLASAAIGFCGLMVSSGASS